MVEPAKHILVTGALGTIGAHLCTELENRGHVVFRTDVRHSCEDGYSRADVSEYRQLQRLWDENGVFDVVFHLAAEFGRHNGEDFYEQVWRTNVIGTRHVIEMCRDTGSRLVFASSSEIYGDSYPGEVLIESIVDDSAPRQQNDYAISKWVNEEQIRRLLPSGSYSILRFFNSYGPGEFYTPYRSVVSLFCYRMLTGKRVSVYDGYTRAFMFMGDFIPTLANAVDYGRKHWGEAVNIAGAEVRPVTDLARIAADATGADPKLMIFLPEEVHNVRDKIPGTRSAELLLDHDPRVRLEEGVPITVEWMRKEYGL